MHLVVHRVASTLPPSTYIPKLLLAVRHGVRIAEVDVRTSREGVPIAFHDPSLNGTPVHELPLPFLRRTGVHTLEDVMNTFPLEQIVADVKTAKGLDNIADLRPFFVTSQYVEPARFFAQQTSIPTAVMFKKRIHTEEILRVLEDVGTNITHLAWERWPNEGISVARKLGEYGVDVVFWHEERPIILKKILQLRNAIMVMSDDPRLLARLRAGQ